MIKVAGYSIESTINYIQGGQYAELELIIPARSQLTETDIDMIKNAAVLEEVMMNYGKEAGIVGTYALYGWRRLERQWNGDMLIAWQTSRETDVTELKEHLAAAKEESETMSQAILELAQLVSDMKGEV